MKKIIIIGILGFLSCNVHAQSAKGAKDMEFDTLLTVTVGKHLSCLTPLLIIDSADYRLAKKCDGKVAFLEDHPAETLSVLESVVTPGPMYKYVLINMHDDNHQLISAYSSELIPPHTIVRLGFKVVNHTIVTWIINDPMQARS